MPANWHRFAVSEIEMSTRRMDEWDKQFLKSIKDRIASGVGLTDKQETALANLHKKMTDIKRIPR